MAKAVRTFLASYPRFTLIGATTRRACEPRRCATFGFRLAELLHVEEMEQVISPGGAVARVDNRDGSREVARRSRGTTRIAGRISPRPRLRHAPAPTRSTSTPRKGSPGGDRRAGLAAMDRRYRALTRTLRWGAWRGDAGGGVRTRDPIERDEPYSSAGTSPGQTGRCLNAAELPRPQPPAGAQATVDRRASSKDRNPRDHRRAYGALLGPAAAPRRRD